MPDTTHECPYPRCTELIARERLACAPHWHALPRHLQRAVVSGYQHGPLSEQHTDALAAALDWYHRVGQANG